MIKHYNKYILKNFIICFIKVTIVFATVVIIMNLLGILFFYIHERVWDNFDYGRYIEESK